MDKRRKRIPTKTNTLNKRLAVHPSRSTHRLTKVPRITRSSTKPLPAIHHDMMVLKSTHHEVFNRTLALHPSRSTREFYQRYARITKSSTESLPASITKYSRILPRCPRVTKSSTEPLIYPPNHEALDVDCWWIQISFQPTQDKYKKRWGLNSCKNTTRT